MAHLMEVTNQRRFPRAKIALEIDWDKTPVCGYKGQVTSLSLGGCFVQTQTQWQVPPSSVIFMRLMLAPEAASILEGLMMGRVVYNLEGLGFGVEFMTLRVADEKDTQDIISFYLEGAEDDPSKLGVR